jgi:Right handed beta helix region
VSRPEVPFRSHLSVGLAVAALWVTQAASCGGDRASGGPSPAPSDASPGKDAHDTGTNDRVADHATGAEADSYMPDHVSADSGPSWSPRPCSFYVASTGGDDSNPGTSSQPFATIGRLQTALRTSASKVGCLKAGSGGSYDLGAPLILASGTDDGETWESDPEGGASSAVLDGSGTLSCLIETDANDVTIDGLKLQHVLDNLTCHDDGKTTISNLTITNSDIGFNTAGKGSGGFPPCLMANGANGVTVTHNYIHDCASQGIGLFAYQAGLVLDDVVVEGNVVLRAVQSVPDGGAIYLIHHANYTASHIEITNNFVRDQGTATVSNAHGIYLDEGTNHVEVSGNVIGPATVGSGVSTGCFIADGHDNRIAGNICDLGTTGIAWAGVWWYPGKEGFTPMNNSFTGNIVVSRFAGEQMTSAFGVSGPSFVQINAPADDPSIRDNMYYNYGGGQVSTDGNHVSDSSPQIANPLCSGYLYGLSSKSPAFRAPVSFPPIVGGWGPPGFVLPPATTGSCP